MLVELRQKSQITIPKEIISKLNLAEGDKLEISEKNGVIYMIPTVVYPKKYIGELKEEIKEVKNDITSGKQPVFDNIDLMLAKLEGENESQN